MSATYTIHVIVGQRKCQHEGQYAPEVLECMDEFAFEENSEWLYTKLEEHQNDSDFTCVAIMKVEVPYKAVRDLVNPNPPTVSGTITA